MRSIHCWIAWRNLIKAVNDHSILCEGISSHILPESAYSSMH